MLLARLRSGEVPERIYLKDTRPVHKALFEGMTAKGCGYFAGNYRGSRDCLIDYDVTIGFDRRGEVIGTTAASNVAVEMDALHAEISADIKSYFSEQSSEEVAAVEADVSKPAEGDVEAGGGIADGDVDEDTFIKNLDIALEHMVNLMIIHPYANGNGHVGRFLLFCFLSLMGLAVEDWPLDERPPEPYDFFIARFREGFPNELRQFVIEQIIGDE
ncbi:Fic family protein [Caballeronia sp. dw_19]|uniref:Fic family protein n=1 Tax=Caballeronia sp. dw_19 TaxID=2719791 RepID=UPI001BD4C5A7|nr:Fic family protein [Caballeronia sp. dw_19]